MGDIKSSLARIIKIILFQINGCYLICHVSTRKSTRGNCRVSLNESQFLGTQPRTRKALRYHNMFEKQEPKTQPRDMISKFTNSRKSIKNSAEFYL